MINLAQRQIRLILVALTCLFCTQSFAAQLSSSVDRTNLSVNETLTLSVRFDSQVISDPDFSSLAKDFDVLSQQQSNQLSIANGSRVSYTLWSLRLLPKRSGKLLIPSFNLKGAVSNTIELTVAKAPKNQANSEQPLFFETSVDKRSIYVQEQLILTHRLYTRVNLNGIASDELAIENASFMKIAASQYQKIINGVNHLVVETKYAIFPQSRGTLVIPELRYSATVPDNRDRFSNSFFSRGGKQVFLRSEAKNIEVKPRPANIAMDEWLPSKGISLTQKWSRPLNELRVGEPITRTINIVAQGLNAMQLPPLETPAGADFKTYPDQAQTSDEQNAAGVIGKRTESIAIVPTQAGEVQLPAVTLSWWDTQSNQRRETTLEAQTLRVLPAEITEVMPTTPSSTLTPVTAPAAQSITNNNRLTLGLIIGNLILLIIVIALFWQNHRLKKRPDPNSAEESSTQLEEQAAFKALRLAANKTNYSDFQQALLTWARIFWQNKHLSTVEQFTQLTGSKELTALLAEIDQRAYSADSDDAQATDFTAPFKLIIGIRKAALSENPNKQTQLQPLYAE